MIKIEINEPHLLHKKQLIKLANYLLSIADIELHENPKPEPMVPLAPEIAAMVSGIESVYILCNQRLGDYKLACNPFAWVSPESYIECANRFGLGASNITWQDGDTHYPWPGHDASLFKHHEHHNEFDERMDFLPDFVVMMRAKNLLRANSTFGWWAHELGDNERVFCPDVTAVDAADGVRAGVRHPQFVPFVEGNHMPMVPRVPYLSELHLSP